VNIGNNHSLAGINGTVLVKNTNSFTNLLVDGSADPAPINGQLALSGDLTTGKITGLTPSGEIDFATGDINSVHIKTGTAAAGTTGAFTIANNINSTELDVGGGAYKVNVQATDGSLTVNGGTGGDQVTLGSTTNTLDPIQGTVVLTGQGTGNALTVNDQGAPIDKTRSLLITSTGFTRTPASGSPTSVSVSDFQTEQFNESGSATVQSTAPDTATTINVFGAALPVFFGPLNPATGEGNLEGVQGSVAIQSSGNPANPNSLAQVSINDEADPSAHSNVFITQTAITNLAPAQIILSAASVAVLDISGPFKGGSVFNISGTPAAEVLQVVAPGVGDTVNVEAAAASNVPGFTTTTAVASANVNVGNQGSLQGIQGTVEVANAVFKQFFPTQGMPLAVVKVDDSQDTQTRNVTIDANGISGVSAPIVLTPGSVTDLSYLGGVSRTGHNTYTIAATADTHSLTLSAPGPGDVVNVEGTSAGTTTTINGGSAGHHTFTVGSNPSNPTASTLDPILGVVNINGSATDVLNIDDQGSTTPHIYTLTQGSPTSTLTRSAPGTPNVVINFTGLATQNEHINKGALLGVPPAAATLSFPSTMAAGDSAMLSGQLVGTGELSLSVDWGDGTPVAQRTPDHRPFHMHHRYTQPGTYHVRAVWTDSSGQSGFREMTITVGDGDNR
jgi:hypothetical protein